jgi:ABC-2 type transport system ATP-binding protein
MHSNHPDAIPAIRIRGLTKAFRRRAPGRFQRRAETKVALQPLDLDFAAHATTAIVGANGSGKSTLVRVLATLLLPDRGSVSIFGHDVVREAQAVRRHLNRVSVEASFFKELTPWENLSYAASLYGAGGPAARPQAVRILDRLGLPKGVIDRPMKQLSRGQQQKVAIARCFLSAPSLLLMDEPTTGLDPVSKREVQDFVRQVRAEHDVTVVLCTHDMQEAEALAERVLVLDDGRVLADGSPIELRRAHRSNGRMPSLEDVFIELTGRRLDEDREEEEAG